MTKKDYERAAAQVRRMAANCPVSWVAPIRDGEDSGSKGKRAEGIALWTTREAYVEFFAAENPRFDADRFREACARVD